MIYLLLCILANVGIFLCFRLFKTYGLNTFQAIVFNYITCVITGVLFQNTLKADYISFKEEWVWMALVLGAIFIGTFYMMALTTQRFSMTVSSIASKMSLVIPVMVSLFLLQIESKDYSGFNYLGILLAFPAILLSSLSKKSSGNMSIRGSSILLPIGVFVFGGVIDTSINVANYYFLTTETEPLFPIVIFSSASVIGVLTIIYRKDRIQLKNVIGGMSLGVINYFSIYCLIKALSANQNDGALVYPMLNIGIIIISFLISVLMFKEQTSKLNKLGIGMAVVAIVLLSYQELMVML